jgi:hypothetical protein
VLRRLTVSRTTVVLQINDSQCYSLQASAGKFAYCAGSWLNICWTHGCNEQDRSLSVSGDPRPYSADRPWIVPLTAHGANFPQQLSFIRSHRALPGPSTLLTPPLPTNPLHLVRSATMLRNLDESLSTAENLRTWCATTLGMNTFQPIAASAVEVCHAAANLVRLGLFYLSRIPS